MSETRDRDLYDAAAALAKAARAAQDVPIEHVVKLLRALERFARSTDPISYTDGLNHVAGALVHVVDADSAAIVLVRRLEAIVSTAHVHGNSPDGAAEGAMLVLAEQMVVAANQIAGDACDALERPKPH